MPAKTPAPKPCDCKTELETLALAVEYLKERVKKLETHVL